MSNDELVSPPGTIELGGNTILVAKATEKDVFAIFSNAKKQAKKMYNPLRDSLDLLKDVPGVTDAQKSEIIMLAYKAKMSGAVPEDVITEYITSPQGCAFQIYVLTRKTQPDLKLDKIQSYINDENCVAIFAELDEATGVNLIHRAFESSDFFPQP
jgi:hypothetical protein